MNPINITSQNLIHKNERTYFIIALLVSLITYVGLIVSVIGIVYVGLLLGISLFLHALTLGYIRTNGVRLNPEQFPKVYEKVKALCEKMEIPFVPDIYVMESSGALNAFATRFFGRNMVVLYSTIFELIEQVAENELTFVIAHELAHIKRRHILRQLMILPAMWVPGLTQAYSRACEYTCDRYAAYFTQNPEAAKNCLTILGIGKSLYKYVNQAEYLKQVNEEKGFFIWLSEILSTHPPLPKRIHQIAIFNGAADQGIVKSRKSNRIWIWVPVSLFLMTIIIGGALYAIEKFDLSSLLSEITMDFDSDSPVLINAVVEADLEKVNVLLNDGADPNAQDIDGWTALHWAVKGMNTDITTALLVAGADPNLLDYYGETPLMKAAGDRRSEMVKLLLDAGANIDDQDYAGWTPLIYAVQSGDIVTVELILAAGANTTLKDNSNLTALMHAIKLGNDEIVKLLRKSI